MKQGFYFYFYKKLHIEWVCVILATLAYFIYCCKYLLTKITLKKDVELPDIVTALDTLNKVYPKPECNPDYSQKAVDENVDLSIIVPVYNYKQIFEKSAKTVVNQKTKYNFEIIFVDDGSTDGVQEVLKTYENNPRVKVIYQNNMGIGGARNTGLCNAVGKYIMFMDCDDEVHEDIVEKLMDKALETDSDITMGAHSLVKEKDGKIYDVTPNVYPRFNLMRYKNGKQDYFMNFPGLPWCKVYKRELFHGIRFFPGYWYEDIIIHGLVFRKAESFAYVPKVFYDYKWYENNFSHTQEKTKETKALDAYWIILEIINQSERIGLKNDAVFYGMLLRQLGQYGYKLMANIDENLLKSVFVLSCDLIQKYRPKEKYKLPYMKRQVEKAFLSNNFMLWQLACKHQ